MAFLGCWIGSGCFLHELYYPAKKKTAMKKLVLLLFLITVLGAGLFLWKSAPYYHSEVYLKLSEAEKEISGLVQEIDKQIALPKPLRIDNQPSRSFLTQAGVIQQTNMQREKYGLPPLRESPDLNRAALLKAQDMISGQYFAHLSPSEEGVTDLAKIVGYEFIAIGENLALGNFQNDEALVQGWMDSPGHRANILSLQYLEIGAAVLKGDFEGKATWLAVQHFGLPLAACPQPSKDLEAEIWQKQDQIEKLQKVLSLLKQEIEGIRPKRGTFYSEKVEEYNNYVVQYNALLSATRELIDQYNLQVVLFNECAAGS